MSEGDLVKFQRAAQARILARCLINSYRHTEISWSVVLCIIMVAEIFLSQNLDEWIEPKRLMFLQWNDRRNWGNHDIPQL